MRTCIKNEVKAFFTDLNDLMHGSLLALPADGKLSTICLSARSHSRHTLMRHIITTPKHDPAAGHAYVPLMLNGTISMNRRGDCDEILATVVIFDCGLVHVR